MIFKHHKKIHNFHDSFLSRIGNDPRADWILIFFVSLGTALLLIGWGLQNFLALEDKINKKPQVSTTRTYIINVVTLNKVIESFDMKSKESQEIQKEYSGLGDPSI